MKRHQSVLLLLLNVVAFSQANAAIRWDWTAAEIACAESIDVKLGHEPDVHSVAFAAHLTWLSDVVVVGTVDDIRHDLTGDYPTTVMVKVELVRKGENVPDVIEIVQDTGPHYSAAHAQIIEIVGDSEPTFKKGETVLLFLASGVHSPNLASGELRTLASQQFILVYGGKWEIEKEIAHYNLRKSTSVPMSELSAQIDRARSAQAQCE